MIFWAPAGSGLGYDPGYQSLVEGFLANVAADSHRPTNVYGLSGQYPDSAGPAAYASTYGGAVTATDPLPANGCTEPLPPPLGTGPGWNVCFTDAQLQAEIAHVVGVDRLPMTGHDIYFLVTPNGMGSCEGSGPDNCALGGDADGSYCGYHSSDPEGALLYAVIPYNAVAGHCQSGNPRPNGSTADPAISTISHEHNEVVTDPLGNAWIDGSGNENGDKCLARATARTSAARAAGALQPGDPRLPLLPAERIQQRGPFAASHSDEADPRRVRGARARDRRPAISRQRPRQRSRRLDHPLRLVLRSGPDRLSDSGDPYLHAAGHLPDRRCASPTAPATGPSRRRRSRRSRAPAKRRRAALSRPCRAAKRSARAARCGRRGATKSGCAMFR